MNVEHAIKNRYSARSYLNKPVEEKKLNKILVAARLAPSAANLQPLEFFVVNDKKLCSEIFETIGWAGYLKDWSPDKDEQPAAYIIILAKETKNQWYLRDASLASENIVLTAESEGIGSCILLNVKKDKIREILEIPKDIEIDSVIALGYKAEKCVVEDIKDSVKYWRDKNQVLHVPKRKLKDIMHVNKF